MNYSLRPNRFTEDPNDQLAKVEHSGTADLNDIITKMTTEGGAIKESEARSNILEFFNAIAYFLAQGKTISLDFIKIRFSITGVFNDVEDSFDTKRHQINIKITAGKFLKNLIPSLTLTKIKATPTSIEVDRVYDFMSKTQDETITSGGMVRLLGQNLTIDLADTAQGVYLIANDGTETKVEFVQLISSGELMFQSPANMEPGTYTLQIRARIKGWKEASKGSLEDINVI